MDQHGALGDSEACQLDQQTKVLAHEANVALGATAVWWLLTLGWRAPEVGDETEVEGDESLDTAAGLVSAAFD